MLIQINFNKVKALSRWQNHRVTDVEGTSAGHWVQPPAQAGPPGASCFPYLQGWGLHNLSVLGHPHRKKVFPDIQTETPVFVCAHCLWLCPKIW